MSEIDPTTLPYRPCVGIMLINHEGKVWQGERIDTPGAWQMPQGGVDEGEDIMEAAYRELEEETGIQRSDISFISRTKNDLTYDLPPEYLTRLWGGKYRGQIQSWFLFHMNADDNVVNIATKEPEFSQWRWSELHELPEMIVPFKRDIYQKLIDEFGPVIKGLIA